MKKAHRPFLAAIDKAKEEAAPVVSSGAGKRLRGAMTLKEFEATREHESRVTDLLIGIFNRKEDA